jgi:phosphoribosyl 1,2-cyclic phosphodiesterase
MFRLTIFGTGSRGNSALVSDGETNILIDAGIKPEVVRRDLDLTSIVAHTNPDAVERGMMITDIAVVMLTHSHFDHSRYAFELAKKYGRPVFATRGTMQALSIPATYKNPVFYGVPFTIGTLTITPFPLSHDAAEPCGFFIKNSLGETLVWASDTGTMDGLQMDKPADCYVLEANYDEAEIDRKLEAGELPYEGLHGRLTSEFGHLSIQQAAAWLKENAKQDSYIFVLSPHEEVLERNEYLFDYLYNTHMPKHYPYSFSFGLKCPF